MGDYEVTQYPSLLRSEHMTLVQLFCPIDVAHATVEALGELERIQFKDLNPDVNPFQRTYVSQIRRCDEAERRLRFLTQQIAAQGIHIRPASETAALVAAHGARGPQALDDLDARLGESESRVQAMNTSFENLEKRALELEEARQVLRETERFFLEAQGARGAPGDYRASFEQGEMEAPLLGDVEHAGAAGATGDAAAGGFELEFVAGTIDRARMATFERVLWRVLRGNLYMNSAEIADDVLPVPSSMQGTADSAGGEEKRLRKNAFVIFAHGQDLLDKIRKIAESMGATLFAIDSSSDKRSDKLREVTSRIEDLHSVLYNTNQTRRAELLKIADSISAWWALVRKEKVVFATLNMWQWDQGRKTLVAEGWVPTRDIPQVQGALRRASENAGTSVSALLHELRTTKTPPTFHRTNKFTEGFQNIIDAYGIGSYQEVNPGLFTVVTFPFLFAVMFGDIGHGALMMLSALVLIMLEKKFGKKGMGSEILDTFYFGRYIIFLMGAFAIYTGIMYNDIFSLSLRLGPSQWRWPDEGSAGRAVEAIQTSSRYWIGLDPGWHGAENALIFTNSLKMKMSIVLGVLHMSFAICLQVLNHLHFGRPELIWAEFLPQILFMESIFGYLVVCIVYKWSVDWEAAGRNPPNLLNMLIQMFLSPGNVAADDQLYPGQAFVQVFLLLLALVCVPWMLCTRPYLEYREMHKIKEQGYHGIQNGENGAHATATDDETDTDGEGAHQGHAVAMTEEAEEEGHDLGEVIIHQVIHTIEFCLGCISNTASYLRLWALSLAHAQLSEVLWNMTIENAFGFEGVLAVVMLVFLFAMWFVLTIAILCVMEGLSAFLHALRLHWVEFNSKFFIGAGTAFDPLTFEGTDEIPEGVI